MLPADVTVSAYCFRHCLRNLKDWPLLTGRGGGYKKGGGRHVKFYPYKKGGGDGKGFSHAEGGAQQVLGQFLCDSLKF